MGKGRPRAVERGGLSQSANASPTGSLNLPLAPVYYPSEEEFKDPLEFLEKIRAEAEPYGICKIVPPENWKPPFALDLNSFTFPTKTQAIHQLQVRPASCDSKTFDLEYDRFLEANGGKRPRRKVVFEGEDLDFCKLFNAVKRHGGYDKVVNEKKWAEVFRFVRPGIKMSECAKHVLSQLYREHLYDYERHYHKLNNGKSRSCKKRMAHADKKVDQRSQVSDYKRRRKNSGDSSKVSSAQESEHDQICENCKSGLHGEVMLLCDRCNKGWHIYCLSPPLETIPPGNWYCFECLNSDEDAFGFVPGKQFSLEAFRKVADRTKRKWFGSASCSRTQLEKKFWEIVEGSLGEVEVMYGSDLDTSIYGSGFPRLHDPIPESLKAELWDEYCASPWNLNNLPKLKGSMLRAVHHNIAGVMVPWLYIGMLFSAFCWHFEDHCFYSMNYHHWGEPKCWYSVPGSEAASFEKVMRNCLPDLFDAQPDLLFQLVTMLNPSVLQDNGVPVYTVLQEPGNFVITFPRSYHGGFNLGLNCAEAVNFAPADWLPHGGFGSELYQLYHKPAVLSHEELLCVVAKSDFDSNVAPYLNKELQRIFSKEKTWREQLWKKGVVKTSVMSPRKHPEYVGTEEDPTCIICEQYLYLSAAGCRCRPKTFVCLEHWERLCECNPRKRHLVYRHSLAEMSELLVITGHFKEMRQSRSLKRQSSICNSLSTLKKKVKGKSVGLSQLAEQWLLNSCKLLQLPFSEEAYGKALRQAGQFLWAGPEMDSVRELVKNLAEAKNWAESVRSCLSNLENWRDCGDHSELQKMQLEHISSLLAHDSPFCYEPGRLKLKEYAEAAVALVHDICAALSKLPVSISDLENVHKRATEFPIHVKETDELSYRISMIKAWINNVRKCALDKSPASVNIDALLKLKVEMLELQLAFPESEMLLALIGKTEWCQARCSEMLKNCITLKELELLIQDYECFPVDIPELKLLRKYYSDAVSWISQFNQVISGTEDQDDLESAIAKLNSLKEDGALLKVQVEECDRMDIELRRMYCRRKALEARTEKKPLDFIKQVLADAAELQIDEERLFLLMSEVLTSAMSWEEQATQILFVEGSMRDYENCIRDSVDIHAVLPSLSDVKDALAAAKMWLQTSEPFLQAAADSKKSDGRLLSYEALKEQAHNSTLLRVSVAERMEIEMLLKRSEEWRFKACGILKDVEEMVNSQIVGNDMMNALILNIDQLITTVERVIADGFSLGFKYPETSNLQAAHSTMQWCSKVISFISVAPYKEIMSLDEVAGDLPSIYSSSFLLASLIDGVSWLKRASQILSMTRDGVRTFSLADAEDALADSQRYAISFSALIRELEDAIKKHKGWLQKVHMFFSIDSTQRQWSSFLQLKEVGETDAFSCSELNTITAEYKEIEEWKLCCEDLVVGSPGEDILVNSLLKIKKSLHRSLYIYEKLSGGNVRYFCTGCSNGSDEGDFIACSFCSDWYHHKCLVPKDANGNIVKDYTCPYCLLVENGSIRQSKDSPLKYEGKRPKLELLMELLSDAQKFCVWVEEKILLQEIVDQALACRKCLTEIVDSALACTDRDVSSISQKLTIPLKALDVIGVYDPLSREKFDKALARNSWRVRALKLLEGSQKPLMLQLLHHLKEASTIEVPSEDYYRRKLLEVKQIGLEWAETAKKVAADNGELPLDQVFDLIIEGQNLPVRFEKELKLLRDRSTLYCICRKPYDNKSAMIACDHCQEWYHFDCVNVTSPLPKVYICPACDTPQLDRKGCFPSYTELEGLGSKTSEPKTPSPRHTQSLWIQNEKACHKLSKKLKKGETENSSCSKRTSSTGLDHLFWSNRRPFSRVSKKRLDLGSLASF